MWKNNNFFIGFLGALLLTFIAAGIILFAGPFLYGLISDTQPPDQLMLLAVFPWILLMRWYFKKLNFTKSGSGALVLVFIFILLHFLVFEKLPNGIF